MTNANNSNQEIYTLLAELTRRQIQTQEQIERTQQQIERTQQQVETTQQQLTSTQFEVESLTRDVQSVFARNAFFNDYLQELRDSHETMKQNFEQHLQNYEQFEQRFERHLQNFDENQRTTNAALNSLEAILLRLTRDDN